MPHPVKCYYCEQIFDRDRDPCVKLESNGRYAHKACADEGNEDLAALEKYVKTLFDEDFVNAKVKKQIRDFKRIYKYSYSGMLKALKWWYEVKGNSIDKAYNGIGIVPFIYKEAYDYYYNLFLIQNMNKDITLEDTVRQVTIPPPKLKEKQIKLFNIDLEGDSDV